MTDYVRSIDLFYHRFGNRIVENWRKQPSKVTEKPCFLYTYDSARKAMQQLGGAPFPTRFDSRYAVCALWGSNIDIGEEKWLTLPIAWRGRGAPGAMMYEGRGTKIYEGPEIFQGVLEPGAVLQGWRTFQDYINVRAGKEVTEDRNGKKSYGHSFYFREYVRDKGGRITGMWVIDAKFYAVRKWAIAVPSDWGYLCATNLRCVGGPFTNPMPWPPKEIDTGTAWGPKKEGNAYGQ